ncbi:hypothetical protein ALC60_10923 [Trachymyrmex zeteki]|uniref:Uncharacterized protein n=1 Tax=Mycetomoellerius zeteki TaxID=64791 RepID=A0A151WQ45_9HYME|nr:hypothetical protein ALC60_10923 [Trachymyrmex zeteki]
MKYHVDDGRRSRVTRRRPTPTLRRGVPPCGGRDVSKVNNITKHKREQSKYVHSTDPIIHLQRVYMSKSEIGTSNNYSLLNDAPNCSTYIQYLSNISIYTTYASLSDVKLTQRRTRGQGRAEERVGEFVGHYIERRRKLRAADEEGEVENKTHCQANPPVIPSRSRSLRLRCLEGMVSSGLIGGPPPPPPAPLPPPENNAIPSAFR